MTRSGVHVPRSVLVKCADCNSSRYVSQHHARSLKAGKHSSLCPECRLKPAVVEVTDRYKNYWLQRHSMTEIREMAAGLDMLLNDHSRTARNRLHKGVRQEPTEP